MKLTVRKNYSRHYLDPIRVRRGDIVIVRERASEWQGWKWCLHPDGREGWVPEKILKLRKDVAEILEDYDAAELSVASGESVEGEREESGWIWCRNRNGEAGWLPREIFH